jgi:hypothetical protein
MFALLKRWRAPVLSESAPVKAGPNVYVAQRDCTAVLLDGTSGNYYALDEVGIRIWHLVGVGLLPFQIFDVIEYEYAGTAEDVRADAVRFLTSMLELQLVTQ